MVRFAINGLGRIGRAVTRAYFEGDYPKIELVAFNGPAMASDHAHLLQYDSVHGKFSATVDHSDKSLIINGKDIPLSRERDITQIKWPALDAVLECSGKFNKRALASAHLNQGASKVLVSAPCEQADATIVYGVNHQQLSVNHKVISIGSCTTNCLAPVAKVMNQAFGIENGFVTTVHAYTGDQNLIDGSHKDLRRARAAALSMIPTSTGAAKSIGIVIPELEGKLDGTAIRVPTPNVSLIDFTFTTAVDVTLEQVNNCFIHAATSSELKGVLAVSKDPLVSTDYNHNPASATVDLLETKVLGKRMVRILAWYDNEWAFALRMLDVLSMLAGVN